MGLKAEGGRGARKRVRGGSSREAAAGGEEEFIIERILSQTEVDDATFYLIQWKGYDSSYNSGEPEANLAHIAAEWIEAQLSMNEDASDARTAPGGGRAEEEEASRKPKEKAAEEVDDDDAPPRRPSSSSISRVGCRAGARTRRGCGGRARAVASSPSADRRWRAPRAGDPVRARLREAPASGARRVVLHAPEPPLRKRRLLSKEEEDDDGSGSEEESRIGGGRAGT